MEENELPNLGPSYVFNPAAIEEPLLPATIRARRILEGVLLDGLREWARRNGMASYNKIAIRGDDAPLQVGQFLWDLTGPSYLLPMARGKKRQGFLVADVFAGARLDVQHIAYFIRKAQIYSKTSNSGALFPMMCP